MRKELQNFGYVSREELLPCLQKTMSKVYEDASRRGLQSFHTFEILESKIDTDNKIKYRAKISAQIGLYRIPLSYGNEVREHIFVDDKWVSKTVACVLPFDITKQICFLSHEQFQDRKKRIEAASTNADDLARYEYSRRRGMELLAK